ncbi:MAG: CBS domain-containing protein [Lacibacter sp.]
MTAAEILTNDIPVLQLNETAATALDRMAQAHLNCLPLLDGSKYVGVIREEDLLEADERRLLSELTGMCDPVAALPTDFFLLPLKLMHLRKCSLVPVVNAQQEYLGAICAEDLLHVAARYNAADEPGGIILFQIKPLNFSISEIGRIVESNDAKIIHINTWNDTVAGMLMVAVKINKTDIHDILASFERYEYEVVQYFGENLSEAELRDNYRHLMNYLNI